MIYIDSDGVLADFEKWVKEINPKAFDSSNIHEKIKDVDRVMVENYLSVFLDMEECNNSESFLNNLRENEEYMVLTALPRLGRLQKEFPEIEDMEHRVNVMRENKFRWFELRGIPRCKVIITDASNEKTRYCKSSSDVLYDDRDLNIERWIKKGGIGILVNNN